MPSHNVGCGLDSGVLRCDILSGLKPEPSEACELDWTGVVLDATSAAQPECAGDTVVDQSAPVLGYAEKWSREGLTCVSRQSGLECKNAAGHGFRSRASPGACPRRGQPLLAHAEPSREPVLALRACLVV